MSEMKFATPVFIREKNEAAIDLAKTPYFFNDRGRPKYL